MSITDSFKYTVDAEEHFEQYAFPSKLHTRQSHFVDRDGDGPWELSVVQLKDSLSPDEAQTLIGEIESLIVFMTGLNQRELRRITEPGEPELAGVGGGL